MKRAVLSLVLLLGMCPGAQAGEWTGSIKMGHFQEETTLLDQVKISLTDAVRIAGEQLPGTAVKAELDREDGYLVYAVEVVDKSGEEREVIIDPVTGKVLEKDDVD